MAIAAIITAAAEHIIAIRILSFFNSLYLRNKSAYSGAIFSPR